MSPRHVRDVPAASSAPRLGHRPALDGLRGVAFLLVFLGHAAAFPFPLTRPAQAAMFLFFGLSGFLITALLVEERARRGAVSLRRFFARRALRLLPALLAFLAVWLVIVAIFPGRDWLLTTPGSAGTPNGLLTFGPAVGDALVGAGYIANWTEILGNPGLHPPLIHLWSLSVEEQFYVLWAPLLAFALWLGASWRHERVGRLLLGGLAVALVIASLGDAWFEYFNRGIVQLPRVTYGTDTRAGSFLFGGALAVVWSSRRCRRLAGRAAMALPSAWRLVGAVLPISMLALLLISGRIEGDAHGVLAKSMSYVGGTVSAPLLVLGVLVSGRGLLARALAHPVAVYVGQRSYALYLWHYVFLTWFHSFHLAGEALALAATFGAAELSWQLVEARALRLKARLDPSGAQAAEPPDRSKVEMRRLTRSSI